MLCINKRLYGTCRGYRYYRSSWWNRSYRTDRVNRQYRSYRRNWTNRKHRGNRTDRGYRKHWS